MEVAGLRTAATRARVGVTSSARPELATLRESRPDVDWYALDRVVAAWKREREEAREALRFLSPEELLERFGAPTRVHCRPMR